MSIISPAQPAPSSSILEQLTAECLHPNGHKNWFRVQMVDLGERHSEAVIKPYETWSEPSEYPDEPYNGVRGQGDAEATLERSSRRRKKAIRYACKTAEFDRMATFSHKDFKTRDEMLSLFRAFVKRLQVREHRKISYLVVPELHDSEKTSEAKRGSAHLHVAMRGRQDYKALVGIWHYGVCAGRGYVRVTNNYNKRTGAVFTPGQMASYLSKYMSKDAGAASFNKKGYIAVGIAPPVRRTFLYETLSEALAGAVEWFRLRGLMVGARPLQYWQSEGLDGLVWLAAG